MSYNFDWLHQNHGIQLIEDSITLSTDEVYKLRLEKAIPNNDRHPDVIISELKAIIDEFPGEPQTYSHLLMVYQLEGYSELASDTLRKLRKKFPDYLPGLFLEIIYTEDDRQILKLKKQLGDPMEITHFEPVNHAGVAAYHVSLFIEHEIAAVRIELLEGEEEKAVNRLQRMFTTGIKDVTLSVVAHMIADNRINKLMGAMETARDSEQLTFREVYGQINVRFTPTDKKPALNLPELMVFYEKTKEEYRQIDLDAIAALPRELLIADLRKILRDGIDRYEHLVRLENRNYGTENKQYVHTDFVIHAINGLGFLRAEEALEDLLDYFRMGSAFTDFYFDGLPSVFASKPLYLLAENQPEKLYNYLIEPNNAAFERGEVVEVLAMIGSLQPERKVEVIGYLERLLRYHLNNPNAEGIIDNSFISLVILLAINFKAAHLLPLIQEVYDQNWVDYSILGTYEKVVASMTSSFKEADPGKLPTSYEELYVMNHDGTISKNDSLFELDEDEEEYDESSDELSEAEELIALATINIMQDMMENSLPDFDDDDYYNFSDDEDDYDDDYYDYLKGLDEQPTLRVVHNSALEGPLLNAGKKVGRNDPCPCGSGKKYKKCCL